MLTMVTNPGLHRGSCPDCTAEYRAQAERHLAFAAMMATSTGRSIDFILDQTFEKWHAASHGAFPL